MRFNDHSNLKGLHSFLSPSSYHWLNYSEEKLLDRYITKMAAARGTELHEFAQKAIELKQFLPNNGSTLSMFVNDAIRYKMKPEQPLFYSVNCFGTADAIIFRRPANRKRHVLRIHDLKTGVSKTSELQLYIYAAIFCLEYDIRPFEIDYDLRIYQNDEARLYEPTGEEIAHIMDKIVTLDRLINETHQEEAL